MTVSALLVCHVGEGIGLGHLMRTLVVAQILRERLEMRVSLHILGDPIERGALQAFDHAFFPAGGRVVADVSEAVASKGAGLVMLDLHPGSVPADLASGLEAMREQGVRIVAIDGLADCAFALDLIYLPSIRRWIDLPASAQVPVAYGWDCLLLPLAPAPKTWQPGNQVLVLTGGADATGLGRTWPHQLDAALQPGTHVHWVRGPYAAEPLLPEHPRQHWTVHAAPQQLQTLMAQCQYAVTIFGVTFFEALQQGLPTVVFSPYGQKDAADLACIASSGVACVASGAPEASDQFQGLLSDPLTSGHLSAAAVRHSRLANGERLAELVTTLLERGRLPAQAL